MLPPKETDKIPRPPSKRRRNRNKSEQNKGPQRTSITKDPKGAHVSNGFAIMVSKVHTKLCRQSKDPMGPKESRKIQVGIKPRNHPKEPYRRAMLSPNTSLPQLRKALYDIHRRIDQRPWSHAHPKPGRDGKSNRVCLESS